MGIATVTIEAEINPTESEEKVKKAVWNLFGDVSTQITSIHKGFLLIAKARGLEALSTLRNILRRERIRDASRKPLFQGLSASDEIIFYLNKQVAFAGHVSFSEETSESPLGPIKVTIQCENPRELIDWLAPRTTKN